MKKTAPAIAADVPRPAPSAAPATDARAGGMASAVALALLLGAAHYALSSPGVDIPTDRALSALAWPAPALGIALLWRRSLREWPLHLLAIGTALVAVGQLDWLPLPVDLVFAGIGLAQVALGAWVARRWVASDGDLGAGRPLLRFVLALPLGVSALHAAATGAALWWAVGTPWPAGFAHVFAANALAVLTLVPALMMWEARGASLHARAWGPPLAMLGAGVALALAPGMTDELLRALLTLPLCVAALRAGLGRVTQLGAALTVGLVAVTFLGHGPYALRGEQGIWALQVDLIGLAVFSLFLAAAIAEQRRLSARLEQARRFETLGFLAGGIAHDFNNLLGTIGACAEIVAERLPPDAPAQAELAQLEREAVRGQDMTQQLLLAARQGDATRAPVDLHEVLAEVLASAQALRPAHVHFVREPFGSTVLRVQAHRGQLVRALHNLLRNAALAARSTVWLRAGVQRVGEPPRFDVQVGDTLDTAGWIEVRDDGPGIASGHWPHLFDPFYSTRLSSGGTGLGLAIVAGVATGHGGSVGLRTTPGQGSCFRLALPLAPGDGAA